MTRLIAVAAILFAVGLGTLGCGTSSSSANCIILSNGGRKLCGQEAKAWCESTSSLRGGEVNQYAGAEVKASLEKSKEACEQVQHE